MPAARLDPLTACPRGLPDQRTYRRLAWPHDVRTTAAADRQYAQRVHPPGPAAGSLRPDPISPGPRGLLIAGRYRWRLPFAAAFTVGNVILFRTGPRICPRQSGPVGARGAPQHPVRLVPGAALPSAVFHRRGLVALADGQPGQRQRLRATRRAGSGRLPAARPRGDPSANTPKHGRDCPQPL